MKKITILLAVVLGFAFSSCNKDAGSSLTSSKKISLDTEIDSVSYALGSNVGSQMNSMGVKEFNYDAFVKAFADALEGNELLMDAMAGGQLLNTYFGALQQKQMEEMQASAGTNLKEGQEFLEQNKSKEGVQVTASGLQYKVEKMGDGPKPSASDDVRVHYHGTLLDGTVFDSSVDRGEPTQFGLNQVIPGWTEGLQLMPVGSKFTFYVPSELGYGANPRGGPIGPNMVLIFEVELLAIL
jgi:FKBP-type peptidyl-prolyl cis-trans isomerase